MSLSEYEKFLETKRANVPPSGIENPPPLHGAMFPHQQAITRWALRRGKACNWAQTGLGKSLTEIEFSRVVHQHTGGNALIVTPLAVAPQFIDEGKRIDVSVNLCREPSDVKPGVNVLNFDRVERFMHLQWAAVTIDESSCLKDYTSARRNLFIDGFANVPFRFACSATPAPNDHTEIGNHAEFLGVMKRTEMLAQYFVHDGETTQEWRLKGHAKAAFWRWVAGWAIAINSPEDIGYDGSAYILPPLNMHEHVLESNDEEMARANGQIFGYQANTLSELRAARRASLDDRVKYIANMVNSSDEPWLVWCDLVDESTALSKAIPDAIEIKGQEDADVKEKLIYAFARGEARVAVSKPSILGAGLNLQRCPNQAFASLSHCYDEQTEVLTKRGWLTFGKVTTDDEVGTVNQETLAFEWQNPSEVIWDRYDGEMLRFSGQRNFDLLVTPNHKMFVKRCDIRHPSDKSGWVLKQASDIASRFRRQEFRMCSAAPHYRGSHPLEVEVPMPEGMRINSRSKLVHTVPIDTFVRIAGWYISEGYCLPLDHVGGGRISICQTDVHPENRAEIIALMSSLGLTVNHKTKDIVASSKHLASFLISNFGHLSDNKKIPRWVKDLDSTLLILLRDTMLKGDGCHNDGIPRFYRTNSKRLADDFQEICLKTGIRASVHKRQYSNRFSPKPCYDVVLAWENVFPSIYLEPEVEFYSGMIGCVTVPNHTVIVRRNGIPVVSGNSWERFYQAIRRSYRFGQTKPVHVHIVLSSAERAVLESIKRKQADADAMAAGMVGYMRETMMMALGSTKRHTIDYSPQKRVRLPSWLK